MDENTNTALEQQNGGGDSNATENKTEQGTQTFDDILKNKEYQSEFDRRVSKAIDTAKEKWQKEADEKISEAKRLEKMNAEQKAEYQRKQAEEKLAKREAEVTRRELMAEAKAQLAEKGLPVTLSEVLDYSDADKCKASIEAVSKAFSDSVEAAVNERMKGKPPKSGTPNTAKDPFLEGLGV